jgi:3-oxoacyl-[acyl-carrier-protein] synthase III
MPPGISVRSLACVFPSRSLKNSDPPYTQIPDVPPEWWAFWGVRSRGVFDPENGERHDQVAERACREALTLAGLDAREVDVITTNSSSLVLQTKEGEMLLPRLAGRMKRALGASAALAFDVEQECISFLIHLQNAAAFIRSGRARHVLVCSVERISDMLDFTDKSATIFGDAAAAAVISADDKGDLLASAYISRPEHYHIATLRWKYPRRTTEQLPEEFKPYFDLQEGADGDMKQFVPVYVPKMVNECLARAGTSADSVDFFVFHQPSPILIRLWAHAVGAPPERYCTTIETRGSLGSASIPVTLHRALAEGKIRAGHRVMLAGAATGWGFAAQLWNWSGTRVNAL